MINGGLQRIRCRLDGLPLFRLLETFGETIECILLFARDFFALGLHLVELRDERFNPPASLVVHDSPFSIARFT